ncbi:MAG: hypothetical protein AM325_003335 [Candidatus Thorarchaeota archaeon SMTZ1-45]
MVQMDSTISFDDSSLGNANRIRLVFLVYAVVLPLVSFIIPESDLPGNTNPLFLSWVLLVMMPIELLLIYVFFRFFERSTQWESIMGPAILMYMVATAPSIYAFIIGFTDSALRLLAIPVGLTFSLTGLLIAAMFVSTLWEKVSTSNQ